MAELLTYFVHVVRDEVTTLKDIIKLYKLTKIEQNKRVEMLPKDLLDYSDNKQIIFARYNDTRKKLYPNVTFDGVNTYVVKGTRIKIPKYHYSSLIDKLSPSEDNTPQYGRSLFDFFKPLKTFWAAEQRNKYEQDILKLNKTFYKKTEDIAYVKVLRRSFIGGKGLKTVLNEIKDFRSIGVGYELEDITNFVVSCTTGVKDFGGVFNLELAPIEAKLYSEQETGFAEWVINDSSNVGLNDLLRRDKKKDWNVIQNIYKNINGINKRYIEYFFQKVLKFNDLVFIKFDEDFLYRKENRKIKIGANGREDYDMIGLVDSVGRDETVGENGLNISVVVAGRDLSKSVIEDGVYFYPAYVTTDEKGNDQQNQEEEKKLTEDRQSQFFVNYNKSLIHKKLANRIFGRLFDKDFFVAKPVNELLKKILQQLSVMDIHIPKTFLNIERSSLAYKTTDDGSGVLAPTNEWNDESFWNLVELYVDESDAQKYRNLFDSTLAQQSGTVLSFLQRIARKPFVELFADTWGEKWSIFARVPPLTMDMYLDNLTIDVDEEFLISENTKLDDSQAFSWFRLDPQGLFFGDPSARLVDFPAVLLDEFAGIFSSKAKELTTLYLGSQKNTSEGGKPIYYSNTYYQACIDLIFLIKGLSIEPFMKKGTIKTYGNRYIKRGMNIYLKGRDMLYYVEGVQQTSNIERRETLVTVSRGIRKSNAPLYDGVIEVQKPPELTDEELYDVINLQKNQTTRLHELTKGVLNSIKVNKEKFLALYFNLDLK